MTQKDGVILVTAPQENMSSADDVGQLCVCTNDADCACADALAAFEHSTRPCKKQALESRGLEPPVADGATAEPGMCAAYVCLSNCHSSCP